MKFALVTRRYPPECCGVGDYTSRLAELWARQGHEVVVFVASPEKQSQKSEVRSQNERVPEVLVAQEGSFGPANSAGPQDDNQRPANTVRVERIKLDGWRDVRGAVEAVLAQRPDAVQLEYSNYGWSRWGFAFWMNRFVRELRNARSPEASGRPYEKIKASGETQEIPVSVALHEFPLDFAPAPLLAPVSLLQRLHFGLLVLSADEVLANTRQRVRILRRWFPWRRDTIRYRPNSSHVPVAAASAEQIALLRAQHASAGALVIATFGTYHSNKNFEAVIAAAGELRRERPVALWLLGDTSPAQPAYLERLRATIRERGLDDAAWWPGRMPPAEISLCLQASDIFVLPQPDGHLTRSSAFMSAAEHGLPAIAVRHEENQAEFAHGENVWLVEKSRAERFTDALRTLAGDAALRERLGRGLRALYQREFAWEVAASNKNRKMKSEKRDVENLDAAAQKGATEH
ncbi:MAG TPA: glycosyltransferase family 4 protein [Candidatus Acidoferrales bacterium]|nr:glycosyltransferase family 4 protein [Candidatus Acidoferrales bacterium]